MSINTTINPCKCGGLPFIAQYYDTTYDETLYYVKCMECSNNNTFEISENIAIASWNKRNDYELKTNRT